MMDSVVESAELAEIRAKFGMLDPIDSSAQGIDRLQVLAKIKAEIAALESAETVAIQAIRREEEAARNVPKSRQCRGLAAEIGLASRQSPARGQQRLQTANVLVHDMPETFASLTRGELTEEHARVVAKEVAWLSAEHRAEVDRRIAGQFEGLSPRKLGNMVRGHAQELDQLGAVERNARAKSERRVSVRPAPEGMAYFTALLPMQQAVGMLATLARAANSLIHTGNAVDPCDPTGKARTKDQLMADTLVQHTTGQASADAVSVEVQLVMTDETLFGNGDAPTWLTGHGPIPATVAKHWLATPEAKVFLRRTFTRPENGQLVAMESRRKNFPEGLRRMITVRDDTCRTPYCDARIKDIDHANPHRNGGPTSWKNGSGLCSGCNQTKEHAGWQHEATPEHLTVTTPTGHQYANPTGPVIPGRPPDGNDEPSISVGPIDIAVFPGHRTAA